MDSDRGELVTTFDLVLAKPVIENLKQFLPFLADQTIKGLEVARGHSFHRYRVALVATFTLSLLLQVVVDGIYEIPDNVADTLETRWVQWRRQVSSIQKPNIVIGCLQRRARAS